MDGYESLTTHWFNGHIGRNGSNNYWYNVIVQRIFIVKCPFRPEVCFLYLDC